MKTLQAELAAFTDPANQEPIVIRQEFDPDQEHWVCTIESVPTVPAGWGLIVGDALHNLRSALDALIWDLSIVACGAEPLDPKGRLLRTQFPICDRPGDFSGDYTQTTRLDSIPAPQRAIIEEYQPCDGRNPDQARHLALLRDITDEDKHRIPAILLLATSEFAIDFPLKGKNCEVLGAGVMTFIAGRALEAGTEILRLPVRVTGCDPEVDVEFQPSLSVAFRNGVSVDVVGDIAQTVETILRRFDPVLTTPGATTLLERFMASQLPPPAGVPFETSLVPPPSPSKG